ncbi:LAG1 longevity assurance homolog 2 isoform X1 [Eucalyptus grandis]|uniref:LAG1 longevity assurance homolog 2 isoform X1 n=1 Tax=Eucalyptus grandis TaxID=71139 RepID=UPI00192EF48B|nr:LAG1 longevity assurance homolog 2 isoform X1 [Eucalyptus grandis]
MSSFFDRDGGPSAPHFLVAGCFALGFVAARSFLDRFVFRRLAISLLCLGSGQLKINEAVQAKIVKSSESMWKLTYHATVESCVLKITYHEPWFWDTSEYFEGWPNQELKLPLKLIYVCQCGFYLYSIAALVTWETRRKDFPVMMSHHVIAVFLIGYSYLTSFFRVGAIVLALHGASDVFLAATKVFKYSEHELGASVFFGLFALSWLVLRLIYFPFWVIRTTGTTLCDYLPMGEAYATLLYYIFNSMLLMLLIFHIYWWVLICSMIRRQLKNRGKVGEDIRSDSEDDD